MFKRFFKMSEVPTTNVVRVRRKRANVRRRGGSTTLYIEGLEDRRVLTAGMLDPTFGDGGRVLTDIGSDGTSDQGYDVVAYQTDGKVVVAGDSYGGGTNNDFAVIRYNADGSLDSSFGVGGVVTVDFGYSTSNTAQGVALDSQGRILVAGYSYQSGTGYDFAVARLSGSDGSLDMSFDGDGKQTIDFGGTNDYGRGVVVDGQDNVLVAGSAEMGGATFVDLAVVRLSGMDGELDVTFDGDGKKTIDFAGSVDRGSGVAVDVQDNVLVIGVTNGDFAVTRLRAADGALDVSFDGDGKKTVDFGFTSDLAYSVTVDGQGNVLLGGTSHRGVATNVDFAVVRLRGLDGSLDTSFDGDGKQTIDFGGTYDFGYSLAVDSQDNVLVAGYSDPNDGTGSDFAVARLSAVDGALDNAFDHDGKQTIDFGFKSDLAFGVAVDSQDNVLAAGYSLQGGVTGTDFAVARLRGTDGGPDPSFGDNGRVLTDVGAYGTWDFGYAVVYQADGKLLVAGQSLQPSTHGDFTVVRYDAAGSLDNTFGQGGSVLINFGGPHDVASGVAIDSQGRILVSGFTNLQGSTGQDFAVARLSGVDGALDTSFDIDGKQTVDFGSATDLGYRVAVDEQDNVLVAGYSNQGGTTGYDFAVARLRGVDGALDTSFDTDGKQTIDFGGSNDAGFGVAVDAQGNVLVVGQSNSGPNGNDFAVARLRGIDGALDTSFDTDGKQTIDFGSADDVGNAVVVDDQDNVLVAGYSNQGGTTGYDFAVTRLRGVDGALDISFDTDGKQTIDFGNVEDIGEAIALDSKNNVLVVGESAQGATTGYDFAVARLIGANGGLDTSFDTDGKQTIDFASVYDIGLAVAVDDQDNALVAGYSNQGVTTGYDIAVARLIGGSPNRPPIADAGGPYEVDEGASLALLGSGTDTDGTIAAYEWDLDNDDVFETPGALATFSAQNIDGPDAAAVQFRVQDDEGEYSEPVSLLVSIHNVAPTPSIDMFDGSLVEGNAVTVDLSATDPGTLDTMTYVYEVLNPQGASIASGLDAGLGLNHSVVFTPADEGDYLFRLRVTDSDGDTQGWISETVSITNDVPEIDAFDLSAAAIDENGWLTVTGTFVDTGTLDSHRFAINWGDSTQIQDVPIPAGSRAFSLSHQYLDDRPTGQNSATYNLGFSVRDHDGGRSDETTAVITVQNVDPVFESFSLDASEIDESGAVTLSGILSDVGVRDDWSDVTIDWGDGSTSTVSLDGHSLIQDTTFAPSDWLHEVMAYGGGGVGAVSQTVDEDARLIDLQLTDPGSNPFSQVSVANSLAGQTYDPSVDGAIASLDFRMDSRVTSTTTADEFHLKAAVRQDGLWFVTKQFGFQANGTVRRYRAEDFYLIGTTIVHPDFSNSGSEIEFGFSVQALVLNGGSSDRQFSVAIDQMDITIYDVANVRSFQATHQYVDDGMSPGNGTLADVYSIQATVSDDDTGSGVANAALTVNNVAPTNVAIDLAVSEYVFAVGDIQTFSTAADFTDVGSYDLHTAAWSFSHMVDENLVQESRAGTVTQATGSGSVSDTFSFDEPGVYTVVLTVTDDDGGATSSEPQSFVVYDPSEGFVTGGGWIDSPAGALPAAPEVSGRATFGFVSKYKKGATAPDGQTQFQLNVADFNFHSDVYDWLVVAGARAQYKGTGTINGQGNLAFMLTVLDGQVKGGGETDKFRIKIWNKDDNNTIVYDNQIGTDDDATPSTELGGGQIVIHKGGKNLEAMSREVETRGRGLNNDILQTAKDEAISLWAEAGVDAAQLAQLAEVDVELAILPGNKLGLASTSTNKIWLDADGAGDGWSIGGSHGGYDLLSAVSHELGHVLGFEHDVLGESLNVDQLRRPGQLSLQGLGQLPLGLVSLPKRANSATDAVFGLLRSTRKADRQVASTTDHTVPTAHSSLAKFHLAILGRVSRHQIHDRAAKHSPDVEASDALFGRLDDVLLGNDVAWR